MTTDLRRPVIVGAAQLRSNRARTVDAAREPLALLRQVLADAGRDAGAPGLLAAADSVYAVRVSSWAYADLAERVASVLGAGASHCVDADLGGHAPVRLLDRAAARIWSGESDVAVIVGAEAQASVTLLAKAGVDPVADLGWSADPGGPPVFDVDQLGAPAMQAAGLLAPTHVYPLFENRLQADLGQTPAEAHAWSARIYAGMSRVAATQPAAWGQEALTEEQVGRPTATNRMVCEPYPLSMNAMPHVDQAAALVVTSYGTAHEHGVDDDAMVHVWGGAGCDDDPDVLRRPELGRSAALAEALDRALARTGTDVGALDLVDVYSCFPVVPKLVALHLGLPRDRTLSVTGGHSSFGGPLSSYSLHALATATSRLRADGGTGLVHANGGYLSSQHVVLLGGRPHPGGYVGDPAPRRVEGEPVEVVDLATAAAAGHVDVVVESATVEHARTGGPRQAFVVGRTAEGARVAVSTPAGDPAAAAALSLESLPPGRTTHVGRLLRLRPGPGGTAVVETR